MKKVELLAPAGNMDNLKSAVLAGADAVYLGGSNFGARAYSSNFTNDEIVEAIKYCHLYGVKVYVTINTLIYESEVDSFMEFVDFLHRNNVDAVLIQDLGMLDLVRKTYPNLEIHSSTQMHIHNLDGVKLMEKLGVKRVVLARELSIDEIKYIKDNSNIELEVFAHGALCICYSGQCLMSSLIGNRSGNRGTCAGSCRLKYDVIDSNNNKLNKYDYPLSTKELNTLNHIKDLIESGITSLKIEGRMKSLEYVFMVVSLYRKAIDAYYSGKDITISEDDIRKLKKIFNRKYTKGFIFNEDNNNIINSYRPNHMGVEIGKIIGYKNKIATILLSDDLMIGSGLRVLGKNDVGIVVNDFYKNGNLVKEAHKNDIITIRVNDYVDINSKVLVTIDSKVVSEIDNLIKTTKRYVPISIKFVAKLNKRIYIKASCYNDNIEVYGNICEKMISVPTTKEEIISKLSKLGDSIYKYEDISIDIDDNIFIPYKELNDLRRKMISLLNEKRLYEIKYIKSSYNIELNDYKKEKLLNALVINDNINLDKYDVVYCENDLIGTVKKLPRVVNRYCYKDGDYLVGEIGALNKYKNVCTDSSFNVTNSYTVAFLHSLGAYRITLSYELTFDMIKQIIDAYHKRYNKHPNVEVIVSSNEEVMVCKFSLAKYYNNSNISLRDRFNNVYKLRFKDDLMYIYNYKRRVYYNEDYYSIGVNALRFNYDC